MPIQTNKAGWTTAAVLAGRLIFAVLFILTVITKLTDINMATQTIAAAGFPMPTLLAYLAALFEIALVICFLTGAYFSEAALLAAAYFLFLGFAFYGPSHWAADQDQISLFTDRIVIAAGLLFAAAHGPGRVLAMQRGWLRR